MTLHSSRDIGLAVFLVVMFILPFLLIGLIYAETPYRMVAGEPVKDAAIAMGITIKSVKDTHWNLAGATGGKNYVLSDTEGNVVTIAVQSFDSAESRDAAIRLYNTYTIGKTKPVGNLVVVGQYLVYVTPANSPVLAKLAPLLKQYSEA
ncbi:MAG TPA: hypothetical protein PKM50_09460 [Methanoregula sp.]|nr:hypothetical protein [Methanoregula sp.]